MERLRLTGRGRVLALWLAPVAALMAIWLLTAVLSAMLGVYGVDGG